METKQYNIQWLGLSEIQPYENNPRKNDQAVEYVANSIREFGFKVPIVIDEKGIIIAGHTRYKASQLLKLETVPCIVAKDLTEEQVRAFRLADNKVGELAEWENKKLEDELAKLDIDMNQFGFPIAIDDISLDIDEPEEKIATELDEMNNYIVLQFHSEMDWEKAQTVFGLERVRTNVENKNLRHYGIGRVIDGKAIMQRLGGGSE